MGKKNTFPRGSLANPTFLQRRVQNFWQLVYWAIHPGLIIYCIGGWVTHVVVCITEQNWWLLTIGGIMFPIGIIHGWMIWIGGLWHLIFGG